MNSIEALLIAQQIVDTISNERDLGATTHIFGAIPFGLAVLIGWHLNACGTVQCYELDNRETYQPTCRLQC